MKTEHKKRGSSDCRRCGAPTPRRDRTYCDACKGPATSQAVSAANRRRWAEYRAAGIDPLHGGAVALKRGAAIAASNREKPRRRKRAPPAAEPPNDRKPPDSISGVGAFPCSSPL